MFMMTMVTSFQVGDRAEVRINGQPATLFYRDARTLVINETDVRQILARDTGLDGAGRPSQTFTCSDADPQPITIVTAGGR